MKSEQIKEITELVAALQAGHSEALTAYLKAIGRFHRYSLLNVLLIASQKPNASYVAGFRTWNELGRFVKKGEKGIMILAPIIRRKAQNDDEERDEIFRPIAGFRAAFVFDISQTDGDELPQIGIVQGNPSEYAGRLRRFAFAISRAVKRQVFAWAAREGAKEALLDRGGDVLPPLAVEDSFERYAQLRHFLHGCVTRGVLTETELNLLIQFKLERTSNGHGLHASNGIHRRTPFARDLSASWQSCGVSPGKATLEAGYACLEMRTTLRRF
jgi:N-terminal domain of anti-restriction factor ArdC